MNLHTSNILQAFIKTNFLIIILLILYFQIWIILLESFTILKTVKNYNTDNKYNDRDIIEN